MKAMPPEDWLPLDETVPKDVFKAEVDAWARWIGVEPKEVHIRPMKHKWGACSTTGRVSFDTDLLRQHADFRKRVIAVGLRASRLRYDDDYVYENPDSSKEPRPVPLRLCRPG